MSAEKEFDFNALGLEIFFALESSRNKILENLPADAIVGDEYYSLNSAIYQSALLFFAKTISMIAKEGTEDELADIAIVDIKKMIKVHSQMTEQISKIFEENNL